jgi:DNA repair photolyase
MDKKKTKSITGFREWTKYSVNCCSGCSNDCRYCYAKGMAIRFRQLTLEEWPLERVRQKDVDKKQKLYDGRVMFPSSHDITPGNLDACMVVIDKLLVAGNELLIVSKPRLACIQSICKNFKKFKDKIIFRFTIGALDNEILSFWEPNAPAYEERRDSLKYAYDAGFETSVSVEPMLCADGVVELVKDLEKFVTNSIWIGKMNHLKKNIPLSDDEIREAVKVIENDQSDENILQIYWELKNNPLVRWKDSIKKVVGIESPPEAGLDI